MQLCAAIDYFEEDGCSALHLVFLGGMGGSSSSRARTVQILLLHGADPTLREREGGYTPLELFLWQPGRHPDDEESFSLLERALAEPKRTLWLPKTRRQIDTLY